MLGAPSRAEVGLAFVYANANEHGASGGHTALRLDDEVWHFQHFEDGLFRLVREPWSRFRHRYNDLENRTLRLAWVDVSPAARETLRAHLARRWLVQRKHLERLEAHERDRVLLEAAAGPGLVAVRGAGLFAAAAPPDPAGRDLRARLERALGSGFFARALAGVERRLRALGPQLPAAPASLAAGPYPDGGLLWSDRVDERLELRAALRALGEALPLAPQELRWPPPASGGGALESAERAALTAFAGRLERSLLALLRSERPGRGFALLVTAARHRAVTQSLAAGTLGLLEPGGRVEWAPLPPADRPALGAVQREARTAARRARRHVLGGAALGEARYAVLEQAFALAADVEVALRTGRARLRADDRSPPDRAVLRALPRHPGATALLPRAADLAGAARRRVASLHGYDLLRRNCATELLREIEAAFGTPESAARALGAAVTPDAGLRFVPFVWFAHARSELRVSRLEERPGWRLRRLAERAEAGVASRLREASPLTSTLYTARPQDSVFLLFTDDVFWRRPLYGLANAGWGALAAAVGALGAPLDGGATAARGLRGVVASAPELVFANVRKGSYAALPATGASGVASGEIAGDAAAADELFAECFAP